MACSRFTGLLFTLCNLADRQTRTTNPTVNYLNQNRPRLSTNTYLYSSKNDSNQTNKKEQKKLDSEHNIENTVTYTPT